MNQPEIAKFQLKNSTKLETGISLNFHLNMRQKFHRRPGKSKQTFNSKTSRNWKLNLEQKKSTRSNQKFSKTHHKISNFIKNFNLKSAEEKKWINSEIGASFTINRLKFGRQSENIKLKIQIRFNEATGNLVKENHHRIPNFIEKIHSEINRKLLTDQLERHSKPIKIEKLIIKLTQIQLNKVKLMTSFIEMLNPKSS